MQQETKAVDESVEISSSLLLSHRVMWNVKCETCYMTSITLVPSTDQHQNTTYAGLVGGFFPQQGEFWIIAENMSNVQSLIFKRKWQQ